MRKDISIHEFYDIYQTRNDFLLIDLRDTNKYNEYHIPGSVNYPKYSLSKNFSKLKDLNNTCYLIDYDNEIADEITIDLDKQGIDVVCIFGGIKRWKGTFN